MGKIKMTCAVCVVALVIGGSVWAANGFSPRAGAVLEDHDTGFVRVPGPHSISQNVDIATITSGNSVSCNASGLHTDNAYLRRFDLSTFGITQAFTVSSVDIGVEEAVGAGGSQPIEIRLYSIPAAAALTYANMSLVGSSVTTIADSNLAVVNFPVTGSSLAPAVDHLVVEIFTPNGQTAGHSFFIGSNGAGQSAPSYIVAADCGISQPTDLAAIGFASMHIVMVVNGVELPVELQSFTTE